MPVFNIPSPLFGTVYSICSLFSSLMLTRCLFYFSGLQECKDGGDLTLCLSLKRRCKTVGVTASMEGSNVFYRCSTVFSPQCKCICAPNYRFNPGSGQCEIAPWVQLATALRDQSDNRKLDYIHKTNLLSNTADFAGFFAGSGEHK